MGEPKEGRLVSHESVNSSSSRSVGLHAREDDTTKAQSIRLSGSLQQTSRHQTSREISPPPLKRHRTDGNNRGSGLLGLLAKSTSDFNMLRHSFDGHPNHQSEVSKGEREDNVTKETRSSLVSTIPQFHGLRDIMSEPRPSHVAPSVGSTSLQIMGKRACCVCETSSATSYNPIFKCPGCHRAYHDSCRNPPLIDGVDPAGDALNA